MTISTPINSPPHRRTMQLVAGVGDRQIYEQADRQSGIWSVGLVQGPITDIPTYAELVLRTVTEAEPLSYGRLTEMVAVERDRIGRASVETAGARRAGA